ncbi:MAG TPA: caspase family protein [Pirellulales bacterium]|nr:caspase family protein [Pirellulales bacterium]
MRYDLRTIRWILATGVLGFAAFCPVATAADDAPQRKFALLIGCTNYPDMPVQPLEGPANDVVLMRDLLVGQFKFPDDQVVTLAEAQPAEHRPTYANIVREFSALAAKVQRGDHIVLLLSGHGTQQPIPDPPDPNDFEPDGLDEVFLPADAKPYDESQHKIPNGLVDNELGAWLSKLRDGGALVWVIADCCHSGTIIRGQSREVQRRVPVELIIPRGDLEAARHRGAEMAKTHSTNVALPGGQPASITEQLQGIAAIYAAQPEQSTIELPLPVDAENGTPHGLLTFTLSKVLREARSPMSYRELAERIQADYARQGRNTPTPLLEGGDRDREVLGLETWPTQGLFTATRDARGYTVNAGALYGLTVGSVLAMRAPGDRTGTQPPIGHLKLTAVDVLSSRAVPTEFHEIKPIDPLPDRAACELAFLDCQLRKLRVAVDASEAATRAAVEDALRTVAKPDLMVEHATTRDGADWVVYGEQTQVFLEPATGIDPHDPNATGRFGPVAADNQLPAWVGEHLRRIARAKNLMMVAGTELPNQQQAANLNVVVELLRLHGDNDPNPEPIAWDKGGLVLHPGDRVMCRVKNNGRDPADATLLFVDSGYGISAVFPRAGTVSDNRIYPGESVNAFTGTINDKTLGLEHLVLIAVPGKGGYIDFTLLEQPTLAVTRGDDDTSRSPLNQLMRSALYGGATRGMDVQESKQQMKLITWSVAK